MSGRVLRVLITGASSDLGAIHYEQWPLLGRLIRVICGRLGA